MVKAQCPDQATTAKIPIWGGICPALARGIRTPVPKSEFATVTCYKRSIRTERYGAGRHLMRPHRKQLAVPAIVQFHRRVYVRAMFLRPITGAPGDQPAVRGCCNADFITVPHVPY